MWFHLWLNCGRSDFKCRPEFRHRLYVGAGNTQMELRSHGLGAELSGWQLDGDLKPTPGHHSSQSWRCFRAGEHRPQCSTRPNLLAGPGCGSPENPGNRVKLHPSPDALLFSGRLTCKAIWAKHPESSGLTSQCRESVLSRLGTSPTGTSATCFSA